MSRKAVYYGGSLAGCLAASIYAYARWHIRRCDGSQLHDCQWRKWANHRAVDAIHPRKRSQPDRAESGSHRRSASAQGFAAAYAIVIVGRIVLGQWWNPDTWWNDVVGFTKAVAREVETLVKEAIRAALGFVNDVITLGLYLLNEAVAGIDNVLQGVSAWIQTFYHLALSEVDRVGGWIGAAVDAFYHDVIVPLYNGLVDFARGLVAVLGDIVSALSASLDWLVANIVDPLWSWVARSADIVGAWIMGAVDAFYHDVLLPLWATAQSYFAVVDQVWTWFVHYAEVLAVIVERVLAVGIDWLLHPSTFFQAIAQDIEGLHWLSWAQSQVENLLTDDAEWSEDLASYFT